MGDYYENLSELTKLIGKNRVDPSTGSTHPIACSLRSILEFHDQGAVFKRDFVNAQLSLLVKNLSEVKAHYQEQVLRTLLKTLRGCNQDTYYGIRLEVSVAASLIRQNICFEKTERPDFKLDGQYSNSGIECTSTHLSGTKPDNPLEKVIYALNLKARESYCARNVALFVDFTNINFHCMNEGKMLSGDDLKDYVKGTVTSTGYGSVLLWSYMANMDSNGYQWKYHRFDNQPSSSLLAFLGKAYPFGRDVTHQYQFSPTS